MKKLTRKEKKNLLFEILRFIEPESLPFKQIALFPKDREKIELICKLKMKEKKMSVLLMLCMGIALVAAFYYEKRYIEPVVVIITSVLIGYVVITISGLPGFNKKLYTMDLDQGIKIIIDIIIENKISNPKIGNVFKYKYSGVIVPLHCFNTYQIGDALRIEFTPCAHVLLNIKKE